MRYLKRGAALLAALFAIVLLGAGVVYVIFTGPNDLYIYPAADASPYLLPWKGAIPDSASRATALWSATEAGNNTPSILPCPSAQTFSPRARGK